MPNERESALTRTMAAMLAGDPQSIWPDTTGVHAWRLIRWEGDVPLTDEQREALLEGVEHRCIIPLPA